MFVCVSRVKCVIFTGYNVVLRVRYLGFGLFGILILGLGILVAMSKIFDR